MTARTGCAAFSSLEEMAVTPALVYWGSLYGMAEMLLSGITTFLDMYYFEDQAAEACDKAGMRGILGETVIGQKTCDSAAPYGGLAYGENFIQKWAGHPRITPMVCPHATNTSSPEYLQKTFAMCEKYDTLFTLHASEMDYEMKEFAENYHMTPTAFLDHLGILTPRTLLAHCIHMTEADLDLTAKRGASVAHCIGSNTKAGKGVAPGEGNGKPGDSRRPGHRRPLLRQYPQHVHPVPPLCLLPQNGKP